MQPWPSRQLWLYKQSRAVRHLAKSGQEAKKLIATAGLKDLLELTQPIKVGNPLHRKVPSVR
jgi:hypothetical protein